MKASMCMELTCSSKAVVLLPGGKEVCGFCYITHATQEEGIYVITH